MSQINLLDLSGKEVGKIKLNETIFGVEKNEKLIHQAVVCQMANARQSNAHTKTRGEVRGGGAKPWKQKGTGRARAGTATSPIWIGGGTVFGPRNDRNYSLMINKKMKRKALLMALSDKVKDKKFIITDELTIKEPKTKLLVEILNTLPTNNGTILIVLSEENINIELAASNIPYIKLIKSPSLNILDILKFDYILTNKSGLNSIETLFSGLDKSEKEEIDTEVEIVEEKPKETKADQSVTAKKTTKKTNDAPAKTKKEKE